MPPPSFAGPTGGRVCPARYVNCLACRGGYHPPASVGATCGRPSAGGAPRGARPMGPPRRPNGVVVVGRGGPAEGMSFRACPEANDPQLGPTTAPPFLPKEMGEKKGRGLCPMDPQTGAHGGGGMYGQGKDQPRIAARFVGTSSRSFASPQAAKLTPSTVPPLPTEPASLGFGGGPVFAYVTDAAAPRVARIGITPQALTAAALYRVRPPGRHRCHAAEIPR